MALQYLLTKLITKKFKVKKDECYSIASCIINRISCVCELAESCYSSVGWFQFIFSAAFVIKAPKCSENRNNQ